MRTDDFLLEIGTEELPPKSLKKLITSFADNISSELLARQFSFSNVNAYGTPRRLAVVISDLTEFQAEQNIEKRGPSIKAAYNSDGETTKALEGFARSCGVIDVTQLERLATDKGEWVVFRETKAGKSIGEEIEAVVASAINALPVERRMRWGKSRTEFVRPAHWVVGLYGQDILPISVLGLKADGHTHGHRFMQPGAVAISAANRYVDICRDASVVADFSERREIIENGLKQEAKKFEVDIEIDQDLLDEVTSLVEWPVVLSGQFDKQYLNIPEEVLISAMKEHQRYFHLRDHSGKLLPRFITVANIASKDPASVVAGNERVIRPRLSDASFFFTNDTKTSLEDSFPRLSQVVFQTKLGTYHDKAMRISELARFIAQKLEGNAINAARAGLLCKVDLVSDLVGEFPDLQGTMGGHYAAVGKEETEVCEAIAMQYFPTSSGAKLPVGDVPCSVAIADKLDTLVGIFGIGQPPTGSKDPYALRRQSLGVIRIIIENKLAVDLKACLKKAADLYPEYQFDIEPVYQYMLDRLSNWYQEASIDVDVVKAVRGSNQSVANLVQTDHSVRALNGFKSSDKAKNLIAANKRVANILKDVGTLPEISEQLFEQPVESELHKALIQLSEALQTTEDYGQKLAILADQQDLIDKYFDDVLVMADQENVKQNRLATIARMRNLFLQVADFSLLQTT
jgi:glycyl-tRNA synthetase beta chain|tara:strand:- start:539 stop:2596 length:2058 start_codon:yes stop_codon:yes gene_type:complete